MDALGDRAWVRSQLAAGALRQKIARDGLATLRVRGHSMRPLLPDGARVAVRAVRVGEDLRGAVVAIEGGGVLVVHRVTAVAGDVVRARGVASANDDPARPRGAVVGVVCARLDGPWPLDRETRLRAAARLADAIHRARHRMRRWL